MTKQSLHLPCLLLLAMLIMIISSCTTSRKDITYMYGIKTDTTYATSQEIETYRIRPNDHLYIQVIGDDPLNTAFLNLTGAQRVTFSGQDIELITYLVDEYGNISFLQLGELPVEGKTVLEVRDMIQEMVDDYIENTSVQVKLVGRIITVLGEVLNPGVQVIYKNNLTIFEAIGRAGDLTDWGNRKDVRLIRETSAGKRVVSLDLTDPDLIDSEYFYVLPNDLIYVEPASRVFGFKTLNFVSIFTLSLSLVTTILLIVTFLQ